MLRSFTPGALLARYDRAAGHVARSRPLAAATVAVLLALAALTCALAPRPTLERGLTGRYWLNAHRHGAPKMQYQDRSVDLARWSRHWPETPGNYSITWDGVFHAPSDGEYRFRLVAGDPSDVTIDGEQLLAVRGRSGLQKPQAKATLTEGFHSITVRYVRPDVPADPARAGPAPGIEVRWAAPGEGMRDLSEALLFAAAPTNEAQLRFYWVRTLLLPVLLVGWLVLGALFVTRSWPVREGAAPLVPHRLYVKLALLLVLSGLVLNLLVSLYAAQGHTTLFYTGFILTEPAHLNGDSWMHLWDALAYFGENPKRSFADRFFKEQVKFIYPPTSLLLFEPLAWVPWPALVRAVGLPYDVAPRQAFVGFMNLITWVSLVATLPFLAAIFRTALRRYGGAGATTWRDRVASLALAAGFSAAFYPISLGYQLGQVQSWLYVWFVVAVWAWMTDRKALSGVLIGLIGVVKPQLGVLVIWAALRREWRFVAGIVAFALPLGLAGIAHYGLRNHFEYLEILGFLSKHGESYFLNHSVTALLHRGLFNGPWNLHMHWNLYPPYHPLVDWGTKLTTFALLGTAIFWRIREHRRSELLDLMIAALSFTMASPLAWVHHYAFILPMYAVALAYVLGSPAPRRARLAWLALSYLLTTNYYSVVEALAASRLNVLQSYVLIGAVVLLACLYRLRHTATPDAPATASAR